MNNPGRTSRFDTVAIGGSAGSLEALLAILSRLPGHYPWPLAVVVHLHPRQKGGLAGLLDRRCPLHVQEAQDKQHPAPGHVYLAPADYHLLMEPDRSFSLSAEAHVKHSRPSIDVFFESAAEACRSSLIGVILSGASDDGAHGLARVKELGGLTIAQDPASAVHPAMPLAALKACGPDHVLDLDGITRLLLELGDKTPPTPLLHAAPPGGEGKP